MRKTLLKSLSLSAFVILTFLFSSCKKDVNGNQVSIPAAGLMAFNLIPDNGAIGFAISGSNLTNIPLLYSNYTGGYQGVYAGNADVTSYNYNSGMALASASQLFEDSGYYSVFAVGANGKYRNIITKDNLDSLPSTTGQAFVRYINAVPDSTIQPLVNISANGATVFNSNAAFGAVSDFKGITPGNISVSVNNESSFNVSRTISLEQGKIYTVLISGIPGQADTTKSVHIRYIQNGDVTTP